MSKTPKRPRDPAQLAKLLLDMATGEVRNDSFDDEKEEPERVQNARSAGSKGGKERAKKLNPDQLKQVASKAAKARWSGSDKKKPSK